MCHVQRVARAGVRLAFSYGGDGLRPMAIPSLDSEGFLPVGVHDCTLDEIDARFGAFQHSDRRPQLFARLQAFFAEAKSSAIIESVLVNGSFVTAEPEPNDIDLILLVRAGHDFTVDLSAREYNILSKRRVFRRYGFDILVASVGSEQYDRYTRFFQQIRFEPRRAKGILRLTL